MMDFILGEGEAIYGYVGVSFSGMLFLAVTSVEVPVVILSTNLIGSHTL